MGFNFDSVLFYGDFGYPSRFGFTYLFSFLAPELRVSPSVLNSSDILDSKKSFISTLVGVSHFDILLYVKNLMMLMCKKHKTF